LAFYAKIIVEVDNMDEIKEEIELLEELDELIATMEENNEEDDD